MRSLSLLLTFAATLAAALPASAQGTPRRPAADTASFGATRPAAGDSIAMAEYDEEDAEQAGPATAARGRREADTDTDTVPERPRSGPYTRAPGNGGPFSVQASGETAARPPRGEVVWVTGRAARAAASDSARRDTARTGTGQRVASSQAARRDTASASRPARRDTASSAAPTSRRDTASATASRTRRDTASASASRARTDTASATASRTRRDTASATASRPARRDTIVIGSRPAARDTAGARRTGEAASTTGGRTGSAPGTTSGSTSGRTGSASTSAARPQTHTVAAGETFYAIARRYGVTPAQMRAINPDVQMDALEIGDVLRLPAAARDSRAGSSTPGATSGAASGSQRTGTQTAPRTGSEAGSAQRRSHTVAAGETLFGIARRYGVTVDAIRQANDLEGDQLRTGQRLTIPPAR